MLRIINTGTVPAHRYYLALRVPPSQTVTNFKRTTQHGTNEPIFLPYNLEINDSIIYAVEKHSSDEMYERLKRTLALFEREASHRPRVLALGLHPHLIGVPHRFGSFERMLDLLMKTPGVCFMQGHELADWYSAQVPAPGI